MFTKWDGQKYNKVFRNCEQLSKEIITKLEGLLCEPNFKQTLFSLLGFSHALLIIVSFFVLVERILVDFPFLSPIERALVFIADLILMNLFWVSIEILKRVDRLHDYLPTYVRQLRFKQRTWRQKLVSLVNTLIFTA